MADYERLAFVDVETTGLSPSENRIAEIGVITVDGQGVERWTTFLRAGDPRSAVEQCVYAAQRSANRYSYGGNARVTDIRNVDGRRDGYRVHGRIAVNTLGRTWRNGDRYYGNGWNGDYRGWNQNYRGYDSGSFTCDVRYGRVVGLDFDGIRGLH